MTPGFIDLSFVNRGYEKCSPLMLPKAFSLYHYFRNEAERLDDISNPYNIYTNKFPDDFTTMMSQMKERFDKGDKQVRMYLRLLRRGEMNFYEGSTNETVEGTSEEISTN